MKVSFGAKVPDISKFADSVYAFIDLIDLLERSGAIEDSLLFVLSFDLVHARPIFEFDS